MAAKIEEIELYDGETEADATATGTIEDDDPESQIGDEVDDDDLGGGG